MIVIVSVCSVVYRDVASIFNLSGQSESAHHVSNLSLTPPTARAPARSAMNAP